MAINARQIVVGVFDERGLADTAVNDLQNAGFSPDQIYYSGTGENPGNDFWHEIRSLFSREKTVSRDDIARELRDLGLTDDEIRYYENEYNNGRTIVAVNAPGRADQALEILRADGGHK